MKLNKVKIIGILILVIGMFILGLSLLFNNNIQIFLVILGFIIEVIGYLFFLFLWHCPYCNGLLPLNGLLGLHYCPYCGKDLGI